MINKIKFLGVFIIGVLVFSLSVSNIYAMNSTNQSVSMNEFLSNEQLAVELLNEVSNAPVQDSSKISLYNGNTIETETRIIPINDDVSLMNIRTIETKASDIYTVTDQYGLYWGGVAGADGWLVATYTYSWSTIYSPSTMKTTIHSARGSTENLDDDIELHSITSSIDVPTGYKASAHVDFTISQEIGDFETDPFTYTNTITFCSAGTYTISW